MPNNSAHKSIWQTSDAIFSVALFFGLGIHYLIYPLRVIQGIEMFRITIGAGIIIAGVVMIVFAKLAFKKFNQPSAPGKPTTTIVTTGVFRYSRNPLYTGLALVLSGLGLATNILWLIILTAPMAFMIQRVLILPEEQYLLEEFGKTYRDYMSRVRRWL